MHKFQLRYFLIALLFPLFLVSCDDDDDDVNPNVSMLTAGVWAGNAIYFNDEDVTDEILEDEGFDWTLYTSEFKRDGTYNEKYDGDVVAEGKWEYQNNDRVIVFDETGGDEYTVVISKLDNDELFYVYGGVEYRFVR
ncbi:hypothetical protein [Pontibacter populi]|uniref:Lipocalin-like domain-containing protein n=1 Tax=Pontibacter populi TaxID=890055 RepID=A0ABV1RSL5_9BACT